MLIIALAVAFAIAPSAQAQISLTTAVDLALRGNPRVLGAKDDVVKAQAQISQAHDAYVPSITAGAGLGQAYGYLPNPPTLFEVTGGALVYNASQHFYVRSAIAGLRAAQLALEDVREAVAQDTALAFIALDHDLEREQAIAQQTEYASALVTIVQERVDGGQDTQIDLKQAQLTAAQLRQAMLHTQDDTATDRDHLARLIGLPSTSLKTDSQFPTTPIPVDATQDASPGSYVNSAVASAFANAEAKRQQAAGDSHFRLWPQVNLVTQYNRYATFTNSFVTLQKIDSINGKTILTANEGAFGVQISVSVFDKSRRAKARQSAAEASRSYHDAQNAQIDALDGQSRLRHSIAEIQAQADVATLQQQLAQLQLDAMHVQLQSGNGNPDTPQMTPKDEQKARIAERDKFLSVIDATFQLRQNEIELLRQNGELESWLKSVVSASPNNLTPTPAPHP
jgi:outer membrane protein TolC